MLSGGNLGERRECPECGDRKESRMSSRARRWRQGLGEVQQCNIPGGMEGQGTLEE